MAASLQKLLLRLCARFVPAFRNLLRSADGSIDRLSLEVQALRMRNDTGLERVRRYSDDLREAVALAGGFGYGRQMTGADLDLNEADAPAVRSLKETLYGTAELELALEDRGWKRQLAMAQMEFSRYGIQQIILISRLYRIKNPLIQRGILVCAYYVWGRGFEVSSPDEDVNDTLKAFLSDPRNQQELSQVALSEKDSCLKTDGNLFFAMFVGATGGCVVRTIDAIEIDEIITDPDDAGSRWFYHRRWIQQNFDPATGLTQPKGMDAWYVDVDYTGTVPKEINRKPVMVDARGNPIRVIHMRAGGLPKWHFGCPPVYAALDWARAYRSFLEDWASLNRALARFAWSVETQGGTPAIAALKASFATTLGMDGQSIENNPPPVSGSAFISGPGNKLTPVKTSGATTEPEQGRRVMLMVAAAFGLPETFFGDASTGSLATAQSLDRPTELMFLEQQERWREVLQKICRFAIQHSAAAPGGRLREAAGDKAPQKALDAVIDIKFPSILEHDIPARIGGIVNAMTLAGNQVIGIDERTGVGLLLQELGVEDVQSVLDAMYPEAEYEPDRTLEPEPDPNAPQPEGGAPAQPDPQKNQKAREAKLARAVSALRKAALKMQEKGSTHGRHI